LCGSIPDARATDTGKRIALLIGVNRYDNRNLANLDFAEHDVQDLARILRADYEVRLLLGSAALPSRQATKANVEKALDELFGSGLTKDDTVLIAIAGHGEQLTVERDRQKHDEPFFCPRDAVPGDAATLINLSRLVERLGERGGGTNLLLVDACRNDPDPTRGRGIDGDVVLNLPKGMAVFFSCSKGEKAQESAKAGGGHGLFFHYVLAGLRDNTIRNAKKELRWERLVAFVKEKLEEDAPNLLGKGAPMQTPHEVANLARSPLVLGEFKELGAKDYRDRGDRLQTKKEYEQAIEDYSEAIHLNPKDDRAYNNRGNAWYNMKEYDRAMTEYDAAIRVNPKLDAAHNNRALIHKIRKQYDKAAEEFENAIRLNPKFALAYRNRADMWYRNKEYDKALKDCTAWIALEPAAANAYYNRGLAYAALKRNDKAMDDVSKAIEIDAKHALAHRLRGDLEEEKAEHAKAIKDYTTVLEQDAKDYQARNRRGWAYVLIKQYELALKDFDEVIRVNPSYAYAYNNRSVVWREKKEYDKAIADCDQAIRLDAKFSWPHSNRAWIWQQKKEYAKAIADYEKAIEFDSKSARSINALAWLLATCPGAKLRNGQRAVDLAKRACELTSQKNATFLDTLAAAYAESGNFDEAVKVEQRALQFPEFAKQSGEEARKRLALYEQRKPFRQN
jgi:tetratricopeptide (TPR) repeat protein